MKLLLFILITLPIHIACEAKNADARDYQFPVSDKSMIEEEDVAELKRISQVVSAIASRANGALVFISVTKIVGRPSDQMTPFDFFFGAPHEALPPGQSQRLEGLGSGFFVDLARFC